MADSDDLVALYEHEYRIDKRADGTEDFHCIIPSCAGVFSYRTLRALNNHRTNTHKLPEIPKRKRGPKKSESSRIRCRSEEAIKRQVMRRAIDISKREQGCRSMARLRASRLAMAQAGGVVDKDHIPTVLQEVDKSLETWEGSSSRRRLLLGRRIQMARLEWALKGEPLLLSGKEAELTDGDEIGPHDIQDEGIKEADISQGNEFQNDPISNINESGKDSYRFDEEQEVHTQCEMRFMRQLSCNTEDLNTSEVTDASYLHSNSSEEQVQTWHEKTLAKESSDKVICSGNDEAKQSWQRRISKMYSSPDHQVQIQSENGLACETGEVTVCMDKGEHQAKDRNGASERGNCGFLKQHTQGQSSPKERDTDKDGFCGMGVHEESWKRDDLDYFDSVKEHL